MHNRAGNLIVAAFLILLSPLDTAFATCTGSSPSWSCDAGTYAEVNGLINGGSPAGFTTGDTVSISVASDNTWATKLSLTKFVVLDFTMNGHTITGPAADYMINFTPATPSDNLPFELSGLTATIPYGWLEMDSTGNTIVNKLKIYNNNINFTGTASLAKITVHGRDYGVVYNNTFTGTTHMDLLGYDCSLYGDDPDWRAATYDYGDANKLYFEDNSITTTYNLLVSGGQGGAYAFRYNDINWPDSNQPVFDAHGNQACDHSCGHRVVEVYGNDIISVNSGPGTMDFRGGKTLFAFNLGVSWMKIREEYCDVINPCNTTPGAGGACNADTYCTATDDGQPLHVSDSYFLNNRKSTSSADAGGTISWTNSCGTYTLALDQDVWVYDASFDGSSGIGCGSSLPNPSGYAEGVGYFVTDLSCASVQAANIGVSPSTPIVGTLYTIQSGAWVAHWTPYTYPHPLREAPPADSTPPTVTSAFVNGTTATINFDETVVTTGYDAADSNLDCSVTGNDIALTSPVGSGQSRTFTVASSIPYGDVCNLDFVGSTDDIEDEAGNDLAAFSDMAVTNSAASPIRQTGMTPSGFRWQ